MPKRILLVDDEPRILDGYRRMLRDYSGAWRCYYAQNVSKALRILADHAMDVVVTDVHMPGANGFSLLGTMQTHGQLKDIPVIMVTGFHDRSYKRRALDLGAVDLLNKPVQREELFARIRTALTLRAYQAQVENHPHDIKAAIREHTRELQGAQLDLISSLGRVAAARDSATDRHMLRVAAYSRAIAQSLGLEDEFVAQMTLASPLYDIGKIGIPDRILNKQGPLTTEERLIMDEHCTIGAQILHANGTSSLLDSLVEGPLLDERGLTLQLATDRANPILQMASSIALTHHERYDGAGYPHGLAGDAIPLESRVVALASVYDALRSHRPFREPLSHEQAVQLIATEVGKQFDPEVHGAFVRALPVIGLIYQQLSDDDPDAEGLSQVLAA